MSGRGGRSGSGGRGNQRLSVLLCVILLGLAARLSAQNLADRIAGVRDGHVRFSFDARPGVCGNGRTVSTSWSSSDWEPWCEPGPVRVMVQLRNQQVVDLDS